MRLWRSDGTTAGTVMVKDLDLVFFYHGTVNGVLLFGATDGTHGCELWKTDGTTAGTTMVKDLWPGAPGAYPYGFTDVGGTMFFSGWDSTNGYQLWKSDGTTAGTVAIRPVHLGLKGSVGLAPGSIANVSGTLFFTGEGAGGYGIWKSDGTTAGTVLVKSLRAGQPLAVLYAAAHQRRAGCSSSTPTTARTATKSGSPTARTPAR